MKLSEYLAARGGKMLMPCEAKAFGVPHPLRHGWAAQYGELPITMVQLREVYDAIAKDRRPAAMRARRGMLAMATGMAIGAGAKN